MDRHVVNRELTGKRYLEAWCTRSALLDAVTGKTNILLPKDTRIISSQTDLGGTLHFLLESIEFPVVNPGDNIPQKALATFKEKSDG